MQQRDEARAREFSDLLPGSAHLWESLAWVSPPLGWLLWALSVP